MASIRPTPLSQTRVEHGSASSGGARSMIRATVRWVPPPERYQQLVKRARELDPKVIVGVCSKAEIERMEREIDRLEKQAKEKEQNQPSTRAYAAFSDLWQRYWKAYNEVLQVQESMRPC